MGVVASLPRNPITRIRSARVSEPTTKKLAFTAKDLAFWRNEIKTARQKREDVATQYGWEENLKRYTPKAAKIGTVNGDVNIGADFRDVERKKAALFFDTPSIGLSVTQDRELVPRNEIEAAAAAGLPKPLMLSTLTAWHQDMINTMLGPQHANVKHAVMKAIFDCLCPSGVGPVSVGYQVTMRTEQQEKPVMDPLTGQAVMQPPPPLDMVKSALGLPVDPPMPLTEIVDVEVPIYERWFVSPFSPKSLLIPASFKDTEFRRAPWMGNDWRKPTSQVRREYGLKKEWKGTADESVKITFDEPNATQVEEESAGDPYVTGVEIFYRTALRSDTEVHPEAMRKLVLVDGQDEPLVHIDSPYQDFTDSGEMTPDSLKGFVVRPLVLRSLSDSAWIPSDCAVTAQLTKEGEKYREQVIDQREGNKLVIAFDSGKISPTEIDKIKASHGVVWVPLAEGVLAQGADAIMKQVAQPAVGRETYMGMDVIDRDREQILGIGANQSGTQTKGRRTATENSIVQRNSEARFEQERQAVLSWFLDVAAAFDTLILRYADERIAVEILGDVRGKLWATFKGHLAGCYSYTLSVDSGKYLDVEADRRQILQFYGQVRQDPFVNPRLILTQMAEKFGYDPSEFIVEPQPPKKELKASISIKGEDLNPLNPAFAIMVELARQGGWQISPASVQLAQQQAGGMSLVSGVAADPNAPKSPEHPGMMEKAPTINQHVVDESGDRSGPKAVM